MTDLLFQYFPRREYSLSGYSLREIKEAIRRLVPNLPPGEESIDNGVMGLWVKDTNRHSALELERFAYKRFNTTWMAICMLELIRRGEISEDQVDAWRGVLWLNLDN